MNEQVFLLAGTFQEYQEYLIESGSGNVMFVENPEILMRANSGTVIYYGSWDEREDIDVIESYLNLNPNFKRVR